MHYCYGTAHYHRSHSLHIKLLLHTQHSQHSQEALSVNDAAAAVSVDLVRTVVAILARQCEHLRAHSTPPLALLSPHLYASLLECLGRWAKPYLCADPSLYCDFALHPGLTAAFGSIAHTSSSSSSSGSSSSSSGDSSEQLTAEAAALLSALLEGAWTGVCCYPLEHSVCASALELLKVLSARGVAPHTVTALPRWWNIVAVVGGAAAGATAGAAPTDEVCVFIRNMISLKARGVVLALHTSLA
jgi:hypothetical protein